MKTEFKYVISENACGPLFGSNDKLLFDTFSEAVEVAGSLGFTEDNIFKAKVNVFVPDIQE